MLVLLIIFMVAAPLATVDVKVDLPVANAAAAARPDKPVFLSIQADGRIMVGDRPVVAGGIGAAIVAATHGDREQRVFLRADRRVDYGTIMHGMNALRGAGYLHVALVGAEGTGR
jgi:biopolymer transport protein ExbD